MARAGRPGTIRGEAAARGVSEYQIRVERGRARGVAPSVAVGKPKANELTLTQTLYGYSLAGPKNRQKSRYRIWWERTDGSIAGVQDTNLEPHEFLGLQPERDDKGKPTGGTVIGYEVPDPFGEQETPYEEPTLTVKAVTVRNRRRR